MTWVFAILVVLALGGIALVAAGRGGPLADDFDDRPDALVPATGRLTGDDLRRVRFSLALRGYRMSEVDALLTRLAAERDDHGAGHGAGHGADDGADHQDWRPAGPPSDPESPAPAPPGAAPESSGPPTPPQ